MVPARTSALDDQRGAVPAVPSLEELPPLPELPLLQRLYANPTLRSRCPLALGFWLARLRADLLWRHAGGRAEVLEEMQFLLERSERAHEIPAMARRFVLENARRSELEWRPRLGSQIPVDGLQHLLSARGEGRGVLVHFMHFGPYVHVATALAHRGIELWAPISDFYFATPAPGLTGHKDRTHLRCLLAGCKPFPASGTFAIIGDLLRQGAVVGLASDLPGSLPARFLGRDILMSSGFARLAVATGTPVACVTWHPRGGNRLPLLRIHPQLNPREHQDPVSLQRAILDVHEPAVQAWPEALERPRQRWNLATEEGPTAQSSASG